MARHAVAAALCVAAALALLPTTKRTRTPSLLYAKKTVWTFDEARDYARSFGFGSQAEYVEYRCPGAYSLPRDPVAAFGDRWTSWEDYLGLVEVVTRPGFEQVLFVEMGWGADQHGQNATKACVRAARNAIEFNSIPSIRAEPASSTRRRRRARRVDGVGGTRRRRASRRRRHTDHANAGALVPNGYEGMKLAVDVAVPEAYHEHIDVDAVEAVFPYGAVSIQLQPGGAEFSSGIAIPAMGDKGDALVVALCCVTVGY